MAFECPRRSSPPSPMFDADTGCIATDPAPSARRRFRSKTGIENLPANEHAQETPHTPSPTRTTRRIQSGCAGSRPRLRDGMPGSPSQHIDITRAKWIPYFQEKLGRSTMEVYRDIRLDKANSLLRQSTLSATEVALATGFGSSSHFSLAFRRRFGMTPSDVRDGGAVASLSTPVENWPTWPIEN